jgi:hypothetical protein
VRYGCRRWLGRGGGSEFIISGLERFEGGGWNNDRRWRHRSHGRGVATCEVEDGGRGGEDNIFVVDDLERFEGGGPTMIGGSAIKATGWGCNVRG